MSCQYARQNEASTRCQNEVVVVVMRLITSQNGRQPAARGEARRMAAAHVMMKVF